MLGMTCVDLAVATWLLVATYLELPVSTTHSCVGGVIGMALVLRGSDAIIWNESIDEFPYIKGVTVIVISWVTSPVFAAIGSGIIFFLVRFTVLRSKHSFDRAFLVLPLIVMIAAAINIMFLIQKAGKNYGSEDIPHSRSQIYAWAAGAGAGLITLALMPFLKKKVRISCLLCTNRTPSGRARESCGFCAIFVHLSNTFCLSLNRKHFGPHSTIGSLQSC